MHLCCLKRSHSYCLFAPSGDLEEKQQKIEDLELEVERITKEHAKSTEQLNNEISQLVQESEEKMQDVQTQYDAALMEKNNEYEKLEEELASLMENNAKEVGIWFFSLPR